MAARDRLQATRTVVDLLRIIRIGIRPGRAIGGQAVRNIRIGRPHSTDGGKDELTAIRAKRRRRNIEPQSSLKLMPPAPSQRRLILRDHTVITADET